MWFALGFAAGIVATIGTGYGILLLAAAGGRGFWRQ